MKRVSIIIVTYNSEKDIFDCVKSIKQYADIPLEEIELIIVDNNSRDPEPMFETLRRLWGNDVICINNTHNGGYGQGNNVGIRKSGAPVILIMNPDVRLNSPFFKKPLLAFEKKQNLIMYGMKQMYSKTKQSRSSFCCTYMMNGYLRTTLEGICNRLEWYFPSFQYFSGSCFYVRKSMFQEVGLFDENVFMYGEEDDIHYRLMKRFGKHFHYDKNIQYLHLTSDREPNVDYEMKFISVALYHHERKGYSAKKTLQNFLRLYRVLYWREYFKVKLGKEDKRYIMLKQMLENIKELQKDISCK